MLKFDFLLYILVALCLCCIQVQADGACAETLLSANPAFTDDTGNPYPFVEPQPWGQAWAYRLSLPACTSTTCYSDLYMTVVRKDDNTIYKCRGYYESTDKTAGYWGGEIVLNPINSDHDDGVMKLGIVQATNSNYQVVCETDVYINSLKWNGVEICDGSYWSGGEMGACPDNGVLTTAEAEGEANVDKWDGVEMCAAKVEGCTDDTYTEYDVGANTDDGSCLTVKVEGCTDDTYTEYDVGANTDDGSCAIGVVYGCTDTAAVNYDSNANRNDDSCVTNCVGAWSPWTYSRSYKVTTPAENGGDECTNTHEDSEESTCPTNRDLNGDGSENVLDVIMLVEHIINAYVLEQN